MISATEKEIMMLNELRKLQRAIDSRKQTIKQVVSQKSRTSAYVRSKQLPKRYSVEIEFDGGSLVPKTRSFIVDDNTIFRPHSIDYVVKSTLFLSEADPESSLTTITLPHGPPIGGGSDIVTQESQFGFLIGFRDNGSDREWQSRKIPDQFLMSGIVSPFYMGKRTVLMSGTEVFVDIEPILNRSTSPYTTGTIVKNNVIVSMEGFEEIIND